MRLILYFFKEAVRGLYQAKLMTFASIISVTASLFFISAVALSLLNIQLQLNKSADQPDVAAYLSDEISDHPQKCEELLKKIEIIQEVKTVSLISKDSAWEKFSQLYGNEMLESVNENPLPATLEIYLKEEFQTIDGANSLQQVLQQFSGIEQVRISSDWIDILEKFRLGFGIVSLIFIFIMIIVLHFMVSNSIKLTIYARKELVRNMNLVGATRFFITMPFLIEGMLQGFLGGLFCVAALFFVKIFTLIPIYWGPGYSSMVILSLGVFFGWIGSVNAVRKFLV